MLKTDNPKIVLALIDEIEKNATYLSEIDGQTGDGDHGNNMNKGFMLAGKEITEDDSLSDSLNKLSMILIEDIGGSMGPIYGTLFYELSDYLDKESVNEHDILKALKSAMEGISDLAGANVGDKTIIDTLNGAIEGLESNIDDNSFEENMIALRDGAKKGWGSTKEMMAKLGRASRLGERSIGFYDAGATSCYLLITRFANEALEQVN